MGNGLEAVAYGLLGGAKGGFDSVGAQAQQSINEKRARSLAMIQQQYAQDNMRLANELSMGRDEVNRSADNARQDELRKDQYAREDSNYARSREDALSDYRMKRQDDMSDYREKQGIIQGATGEYGKLFNDLERIYGTDEAKKILSTKMEGKYSDNGLSRKEVGEMYFKARDAAMEMYANELMTAEDKNAVLQKISAETDKIFMKAIGGSSSSNSGVGDFLQGLLSGSESSSEPKMISSHKNEPQPQAKQEKTTVAGRRKATPGKGYNLYDELKKAIEESKKEYDAKKGDKQ